MSKKSADYIIKEAAFKVEKCLGNKVINTGFFYEHMSAGITFRLELKNREWFGNTLNAFTNDEDLGQEDLASKMLGAVIKDLPRADRMERERVWGIK